MPILIIKKCFSAISFQIHVIKPVLPKFSRILSLAARENSSTDENNVKLISAWLMALISRMLKHETKFIIKWALSTVLTFDFKKHVLHEDSLKMLIKILFETLNDQSLYSRNSEQDNYSLFLSSEKISKFLKNYISGLKFPSEKVTFFRYLLNIIASQSWCIVALLHITVALSTLESTPSWSKSDISLIRNIVVNCQRSHEPAFRASLEYFMMECCTLFMDWNSLHIENLVELLSVFKSSAVSRHSKPWNNFAARIHELIFNESSGAITQDTATEYCTKNITKILEVNINEAPDADVEEVELEKMARMLMLFADASVISVESTQDKLHWNSILNPVISIIQFASNRPYMHSKKFLSSVKLITLLIKESHGCDKIELDPHTTNIIGSLNQSPEIIEFLYQRLFMNIYNNSCISQSYILFEFFDTIIAESRLNGLFLSIIPQMMKKVEDILEDKTQRRNLLFSLWKILVSLVNSGLAINFSIIQSLNYRIFSEVLKCGILQECLSKPANLDGIRKEQWLRFSHQSICNFWCVIHSVIPHLSDDEMTFIMLPLIEETEKVFNDGPKIVVPYAISCLKQIIPKLGKHNLSMMSALLEVAWKSCLELRGNEAFRPSLSSLIEIIFQPDMIQEAFFPSLDMYFKRFKELSESTSGIFYTFIKQFCSAIPLRKLLESGFNCIHIFVFALTFGPIHQKAHKIMEETLIYLLEQDPHLSRSLTLVDSNKPSCFVRITILEYLLENLKEETKESEDFVFLLIQELMMADSEDESKPTSHFANSLSHRIRNRAWQSILLIQHFIKNKVLNEQLLLKTLTALGAESQQPSIRYLQEWVTFNVLHVEQSFINKFILIIDDSLDKRPSYIISVVSITNLLILHQIINEKNNIAKCFKLLTILCMAQNFTVRLYAQVTLTNLFELCQQMDISNFINQYEFVSQMIDMQTTMVEGHGNFFKNIKKLSSDFYFSAFNPINHFSLETVLYDLPRLSTLSPDEWIRPDWFNKNCFHVLTYNLDDSLKKSLPTSWTSKMLNDNLVTESNSLDYNFQKKIMPVKDIIESSDDVVLINLEQKQIQKDGLIVVASLIDRVPNLGGLCRTCEVFGVKEFVIGSLRYIEDKQFQNLAVSADKWVSIKEVKTYMLKEYLMSMKEEGYTLVGAEQTEDSCNLKEYQFPKKSILLLGHEKEGLPVELIQLLDTCVEIPQQGVVRSLNVHVSGAILIWEYARQHSNLS
ncbi:probable methyltransferase TARBP1 isoform X2 [Argiope bruennichi]|uniref:probable methyltransferase TARBP1 isoform X2 n=1 Tax=Argiope bruennichi TaxID=94029 RepID=UPI0024940593|nr:probable methyltransferase TARBP1 isoform X2 [Argiope bruennichi]